jgi:hypothetical protein
MLQVYKVYLQQVKSVNKFELMQGLLEVWPGRKNIDTLRHAGEPPVRLT